MSRELDAEIAEKVMGWLQWDGESDWNGPEGATFFFAGTQWLDVYRNGAEEPTDYLSPSTDISAAMEVVEKIRRDDRATNIVMESGSAKWSCEIWTTFVPARAVADSLPEAICRAALKAVESREV